MWPWSHPSLLDKEGRKVGMASDPSSRAMEEPHFIPTQGVWAWSPSSHPSGGGKPWAIVALTFPRSPPPLFYKEGRKVVMTFALFS